MNLSSFQPEVTPNPGCRWRLGLAWTGPIKNM